MDSTCQTNVMTFNFFHPTMPLNSSFTLLFCFPSFCSITITSVTIPVCCFNHLYSISWSSGTFNVFLIMKIVTNWFIVNMKAWRFLFADISNICYNVSTYISFGWLSTLRSTVIYLIFFIFLKYQQNSYNMISRSQKNGCYRGHQCTAGKIQGNWNDTN